MNERIEKILEQCQIETYGVNGELLEFGFDAEKFAELIVRECVRIISKRKNQAIDDELNVDEAMSMAEIDLEEHFGVEE
jgi:hypothetical protein